MRRLFQQEMPMWQNSCGSHAGRAGCLSSLSRGSCPGHSEMLLLLLGPKDSMRPVLVDGGGGRRHLGVAELRGHLSSAFKSQLLRWFQAGNKGLVKNTMAQVPLLGHPGVGPRNVEFLRLPRWLGCAGRIGNLCCKPSLLSNGDNSVLSPFSLPNYTLKISKLMGKRDIGTDH